MNNIFTLKARVILFLLLICHFGLKAQTTSDTTLAKRSDTSYAIKSDTSFSFKKGSTVVIKSDTTLVINNDVSKNAEDALAKKAESLLAANTDSTKKTDPAITPAGSAADQSADTTKKAAAIGKVTTSAPPVDGVIQVKNTATQSGNGLIEVKDSVGTIRLRDTTASGITLKSDSSKKSDAVVAKDQGAVTTKDTNAVPAAGAATGSTTPVTPPAAAVTGSTDAATAIKTDTTIAKKADTTIVKKPDTTLVKRSDTTLVQKDTTADISEIKAQNAYLEVGGAGLAISANFDSRFHKERNGWGYRVGLGFFTSGGNTVFTVPFQINYLIGEHAHMLELGAGTTFLNSKGTNVGNSKWEFDKVTGFIATASIGYRFQPMHKGINVRLAFVPILYDEGIIPAGAVSVGYTFK